MKTIRSESGVSRVGEFDGLLQGAVRQAQAANQPENGDYYDDEGFLVCGNCHTRRQVEVNMPDLKAVPFDPMNIIAISGRLTRDPELRTTPNGKPVVEFTVAVDRPGVKDQTDFIDCVAWEKKAEFVARYFKQGKRIEASGVLTTRTYEKNGVKRKRTEVRCDQVFFGESKKDSSSTPQAAPEPTNDDFRPLPDDDDIPF